MATEKESEFTPRSRQLAYRTGKRIGLKPAQTKEYYWRSMIANQARSFSTPSPQYPAPADLGLRYMAYEKEIKVPSSAIGQGIEEEWRIEYFKPWFASHSAFHEDGQSQFFTTDKGRFGIGQSGVRPGDLACILSGGRVILILREHGTYYILAGCAYVHSVMDGEPASLLDTEELRKFEIH